MAHLTPLDEKLGEVLGLAQAAQAAAAHVARLSDDDQIISRLDQMRAEAEETERRTQTLVDARAGKQNAIEAKGRDTKSEATQMMKIYLGDNAADLDGFEFLTMTEAGELGHWEIVRQMSETVGDDAALRLADWAIPIQKRHRDVVRASALELAAEEAEAL